MTSTNASDGNVFLSYTEGDARRVNELISALQARGLSIWHMRGDRTLDTYASEIVERINDSAALLVAYSRRTAASRGCLRELEIADSAGVPIVVVKLDESEYQGGFRYFLGSLTPISWLSADAVADEVQSRMADADGRRPAARSTQGRRSFVGSLRGRWKILALVSSVLVVMTLGIAVWWQSRDDSTLFQSRLVANPSGAARSECPEPGWGPKRKVATIDAGGLPYPAFNSITDNPDLGDERNFVGIRKDGSVANTPWSTDQWGRAGDVFTVRAFVNNAGYEMDKAASASWIQGARLRFQVHECTGEMSVFGILSADNAKEVYDGAVLHFSRGTHPELVPDSFEYENNAGLSKLEMTAAVGSGVPLGYRKFDGVLKPGYEYSGFATFKVRVRNDAPAADRKSMRSIEPEAHDDFWEAGWGPEREMFTLESGGSPYPAFNSIIDGPIGDERNFLAVKRIQDKRAGGWRDEEWVAPGDRLLIRVCYENSGYNTGHETPSEALQDARLRLQLSHSGTKASIAGTLTARNADDVWDGATVHFEDGVALKLVEGSARLTTNAHPRGGLALNSDLTRDAGALLGYESLDGIVKPGYEYDGIVTVEVEAVQR